MEFQGSDGFDKPVHSQSHAISYLQTIRSVQKNKIFTSCCGLQGFLASPATSSSQQLWNLPRLHLSSATNSFPDAVGLQQFIRKEIIPGCCGLSQGFFFSSATSYHPAAVVSSRASPYHLQRALNQLL